MPCICDTKIACMHAVLQLFTEVKCQQDLDTIVKLADRCSNYSREIASLRIRLFDQAQSLPASGAGHQSERASPLYNSFPQTRTWDNGERSMVSDHVYTLHGKVLKSKIVIRALPSHGRSTHYIRTRCSRQKTASLCCIFLPRCYKFAVDIQQRVNV